MMRVVFFAELLFLSASWPASPAGRDAREHLSARSSADVVHTFQPPAHRPGWIGLHNGDHVGMDTIPLFNLEELTAAFALVLPAEASRRWAVEWFSRFADESSVDAEGYYLYAEWWDSGAALEPPLAVAHGSQGPTPSGWRRGISGMSPDEKAERFLMRFSELHLHLLLLVSPELEKRVQLVYQDSDESALRRRQEALRLVSDLSR